MPNTIPAAGEAMPRISRRAALALIGTASLPTIVEGAQPLAIETKHEKIRRLAWEISDLLNGLDPRIEYLTIRASSAGRYAVLTGFDIPFGNEEITS